MSPRGSPGGKADAMSPWSPKGETWGFRETPEGPRGTMGTTRGRPEFFGPQQRWHGRACTMRGPPLVGVTLW